MLFRSERTLEWLRRIRVSAWGIRGQEAQRSRDKTYSPATSTPGPGQPGRRKESAFGAGNCDGVGSDRVDGEPSATETCCGRPSNREDVARQPGSGQPGRRSRGGGRAPPGPPQLAPADRGSPHRDRWLGKPGQRESVTKFANRATGEWTGKMGIARRAVSAGRAM